MGSAERLTQQQPLPLPPPPPPPTMRLAAASPAPRAAPLAAASSLWPVLVKMGRSSTIVDRRRRGFSSKIRRPRNRRRCGGELDRAIVALPFRAPTAPIIVDAIVDRSIDRRSILRTSSERCKRNNPNRRRFRRKRRFRRRSSTIDVDLP